MTEPVTEAENNLTEFLTEVRGPTVLAFEPMVYPACVRCNQPWMLRLVHGVWAWFPDCAHKNSSCKLMHG